MATLEKAGYQDAINGLPTRKLHPDDMPNYLAGYRYGTRYKSEQIRFEREQELTRLIEYSETRTGAQGCKDIRIILWEKRRGEKILKNEYSVTIYKNSDVISFNYLDFNTAENLYQTMGTVYEQSN